MLNINETQSKGGGSPPDADDPQIDAIIELFRSVRGSGPRGFQHLSRDAMSMGHVHVLVRLQSAGPMPISHLARALGVSAAGATGMVNRMEERGLVARERDERDRRVVRVRLAPGGQAALDEIGSRSRASLARLLSRLTRDELTHLRRGLGALHRAMLELAAEHEEHGGPCGDHAGDASRANDVGAEGGARDDGGEG